MMPNFLIFEMPGWQAQLAVTRLNPPLKTK
jgi:hypothetical protein